MDWLPVETTVAPESEPLTLAKAKAQLDVDHGEQDAFVSDCIRRARSHLEGVTGLRFVTQTVKIKAWELCGDDFKLPVAPVQSISSITYTDAAGATQTLATSVYDTDGIDGESRWPQIALAYGQTWPAQRRKLAGAAITAVVGFEALPATIEAALVVLTRHFYDTRGSDDAPIPQQVYDLLANDRLYGF